LGYSISSVGGTCGGTLSGNTYTTNAIYANCTVTASFAATATSTYTVTAIAGLGGTISGPTSVQVNPGGTATFTFVPNPGGSVSYVMSSCGGGGGQWIEWINRYVFMTSPVNSNCTVQVSFGR
jgi:hypothetical protein